MSTPLTWFCYDVLNHENGFFYYFFVIKIFNFVVSGTTFDVFGDITLVFFVSGSPFWTNEADTYLP